MQKRPLYSQKEIDELLLFMLALIDKVPKYDKKTKYQEGLLFISH